MKPKNRKEVLLDCIANGTKPEIVPENREEAYLKKIAEKAAAGGGADLDANEGEAGYVKNRTHYGKKVDMNIVETLQPSADAQTITLENVPFQFTEEAKAYISFAGDYNDHPTYGIQGHYLANEKKQFAGGTGSVSEIWIKVQATEEDGLYNIIFYIKNTTHEKEFTCGYAFDNVKKIDQMYLPDATYYYTRDQYLYHDYNKTQKVTADECKAAVNGVVRIVTSGSPENGTWSNIAMFNTTNEWVELEQYNGETYYTSEYEAGSGPA